MHFQKAPKPSQDKEDRLRCRTKPHIIITHLQIYCNIDLYIFCIRTHCSLHKTVQCLALHVSLSLHSLNLSCLCSTMPHSCSHTILMKLLPSNQTLQLETDQQSYYYLTSHMCMQDKERLCIHYALICTIKEHT